MRRGRLLVLLALLLIGVALVAYLLLQGGLGGGEEVGPAEPTAEPRDATIVIAAQEIPRGAEIPPDAVMLSAYPSDMLVTGDGGMVTDVNLVVGRIARMDIARGVPLTSNMVTDRAGSLLDVGSDAALAIPEGYTAIAMPITRLSSVAYALREGDEVDVLVSMLVADLDSEFQTLLPNISAVLFGIDGPLTGRVCDLFQPGATPGTYQCVLSTQLPIGRTETDVSTGELLYLLPTETQRPRLVTQRIVEQAKVLNVGTFPLQDEIYQPTYVSPEEGEQTPEQTVTTVSKPPDIITLIVSPQDALALNYVMKAGMDIVFTLRSPDDLSQIETTSVSLEYLFNNYSITVPSKPAYGLQPRLDKIIPPVLPNDSGSSTSQ
jgi:Flp pilus assembly protein CpaB